MGTKTGNPDGLTESTLSEIRNVKKQGLTAQIQDYLTYSQQNDLDFDLYLPPSATPTGPLQDAFDKGLINRIDIPVP